MIENPWQTISNTTVYENPWITVTHRDVITPGGKEGIYGVVHFKNVAVGIVPLDNDGYTWLVGQYRYTLDQYSWEIPCGGCPLGTTIETTALRELKEETGLVANEIVNLGEFYLSNSITDEKGVIFLAKDLIMEVSEPEDTELIHVKKLKITEAIEMVYNGLITDGVSIIGLLKVAKLLKIGL